ncbi:MAG: hypothetical protein H8D56_10145 [Planctomycetes bacterium]|nr:hypothetical protein [Planctomycetota bacterium]MBL7143619.1 hypothetical protein [Phycisphaerae bacterium]
MTDISQITEEELKQYIKRLTLYAQKKFFKLGWVRKGSYRIDPQGMGPQDVVAEAIIRVIEGKRKYNKQAYPVYMDFLRSVVDSIIWNMLNLVKHKKVQPLPSITNNYDQKKVFEIEDKKLSPVQNLINKEMADNVKAILISTFSNDDVVCGILECFKAGIIKRSEIAEYLEVKTKDVDNAKKRLRRAIETKLQEYKLEDQK